MKLFAVLLLMLLGLLDLAQGRCPWSPVEYENEFEEKCMSMPNCDPDIVGQLQVWWIYDDDTFSCKKINYASDCQHRFEQEQVCLLTCWRLKRNIIDEQD